MLSLQPDLLPLRPVLHQQNISRPLPGVRAHGGARQDGHQGQEEELMNENRCPAFDRNFHWPSPHSIREIRTAHHKSYTTSRFVIKFKKTIECVLSLSVGSFLLLRYVKAHLEGFGVKGFSYQTPQTIN